MKKITRDIFQIGGSGLTSGEDAAVWLIRSGTDAALVDAGCGPSVNLLLKHLSRCGATPQQVKYLLLTHCHFDHTGGAAEIRKRTGCRILAHELDAVFLEKGDNAVTAASWYGSEMLPFTTDIKISGKGTTLAVGDMSIEAIHTPGHSPGSMVFLTESEGLRVLFGQDIHGPLSPVLLSNEADYQNSLTRLLEMNADILCEGHYGIFRGKGVVREFIRSFMTRQTRL